MSKTPVTDSIRKQTKRELNTQFNNLIGKILSDLPAESPQYTGFFASSWQANTYRPLSNEKRIAPWTQIKKDRDNGIKTEPEIRERYPLDRNFQFGETVFIGNRAEYARQALGSPTSNIIGYLTEIEKVVEFVFGGSMNRPDVRVADSQVLYKDTEGGRSAPALGSKYRKL
jgi:hypothetical protein|tara:strand:+ start:74 stop:586 length:513 start_codon:yes stop_codon:yes gene_type:complete